MSQPGYAAPFQPANLTSYVPQYQFSQPTNASVPPDCMAGKFTVMCAQMHSIVRFIILVIKEADAVQQSLTNIFKNSFFYMLTILHVLVIVILSHSSSVVLNNTSITVIVASWNEC